MTWMRSRNSERRTDLVTYEFENIDIGSVRHLERTGYRVLPSSDVLHVTQDRLREKTFARENGIATTEFAAVRNARRSARGGAERRISGSN